MSTPRIAVALAAAFFATTASWFPGLKGLQSPSKEARPAITLGEAVHAPAPSAPEVAWPPPQVSEAPGATSDITARMELTARGSHRLVLEKKGTFLHLAYREVESAGPDWAAIELRSGDRAPKGDVAVVESTDPQTLATERAIVRFSLGDAQPEVVAAQAPRLGPRDVSAARTCQSHEDGASGFAVVCKIAGVTSGVHAARPASAHPLGGAWVWDLPKKGKAPGPRFVRMDLPLAPGGAEVAALAYVHGGKGVIVRADATWPSASEPASLIFTETSRTQPVSPFFSWR